MTESIETRTAVLETHYEDMDKKLDSITDKVDNLTDKIDSLPDKFDMRYASKETEVSVKRVMWIVLAAVLASLLGLILKQ